MRGYWDSSTRVSFTFVLKTNIITTSPFTCSSPWQQIVIIDRHFYSASLTYFSLSLPVFHLTVSSGLRTESPWKSQRQRDPSRTKIRVRSPSTTTSWRTKGTTSASSRTSTVLLPASRPSSKWPASDEDDDDDDDDDERWWWWRWRWWWREWNVWRWIPSSTTSSLSSLSSPSTLLSQDAWVST